MSKKVALISGITGQDGSFLAEFLIEKMFYSIEPPPCILALWLV